MSDQFRVSLRFLQPYSHGRGEDGSPEWPPSPLRLFQALVASGVGHQFVPERRARAVEALRWLEQLPAPEIFAAPARPSEAGYRSFVPDNVGDRVAKAWSAGREASLADYRTEKDVLPVRLAGELPAVHYCFEGAAGLETHTPVLRDCARSVTHLGWGIDMVVGDASDDLGILEGERWSPGRAGGVTLRRPVEGTFDALEYRHEQFLRRLEGGTFRPVSPLTAFIVEPYARATDTAPRPRAAFRLVDPGTGDRLSFDAIRRARDVAAWLRHAVDEAAEGWSFGAARSVVHGHGSGGPRLSYLPLPSINSRLHRVEGIARVLISGPPELAEAIAFLESRLAGDELKWKGEVKAVLEPLPKDDWVLKQYVKKSTCWSTVTPVVLPGWDDGSPRKAERLLRKAFLQAGSEPELVDGIQELDWRRVGFRRGVEHASRYLAPDKVVGPRFHVRVRFAQAISGPLALGSGRYRGMGVFAAEAPERSEA